MRDDFPEDIKRALAARVANQCSNPDCRAVTSGPQTDPSKAVNVGVAAHITAASPGGPRHDPELSPPERQGSLNGIWLCQTCAKLVDNDPVRFTSALLRQWKAKAEQYASINVGKTASRSRSPRALEPALEIVFDPACESCFDETGTQVCLGIWNKGRTVAVVHAYLASVTPGPKLGKLEFTWRGEHRAGRSIHMSIPSGHHHFHFLASESTGSYYLLVGAPVGALPDDHPYAAEILVEGKNIAPIRASVEVDPRTVPPVLKVTPL